MDEFELIAAHFAPLAGPGGLGLTDDAAVIAPPPGQDLVVTTDTLVAGVHFFADDPPADIARKLIRVNLSDLAAKGADPSGYLLAASWPSGVSEAYIAAFAAGLAADQAAFGLALLGGDTTRTGGPLTLTLTAVGTVPAGAMVRRSGAKAGDHLWVSGTIGDGGLGLQVARGGLADLANEDRGFLLDRYRVPQPRVAFGRTLPGIASASIDVSDGLVADAGHVAKASGVQLVLRIDRLPLSPAAFRAQGLSVRPVDLLGFGDDYELLLAVPPEREDALRAAGERSQTRLTRIGEVRAGTGVVVEGADGRAIPIERAGYRHF